MNTKLIPIFVLIGISLGSIGTLSIQKYHRAVKREICENTRLEHEPFECKVIDYQDGLRHGNF